MRILSNTILLGVLILSIWAVPQPLFAQHSGHGGGTMTSPPVAAPMPKTGTIKSQVVEIGEESIVVEGKYQGKVQKITLMMDKKTKKEGKIETGSPVTVKYREEMGGMLYATALKGPKSR